MMCIGKCVGSFRMYGGGFGCYGGGGGWGWMLCSCDLTCML